MKKVAVSACLLGKKCRYDGKCKIYPNVIEYVKDKEVYEICPEVMGGLPIPRTPCEIVGSKVIDKEGNDKTNAYELGAKKALQVILDHGVEEVILKSKSPSCGLKQVYDGTFSRTLVNGKGITARLLSNFDICLIDSDDV